MRVRAERGCAGDGRTNTHPVEEGRLGAVGDVRALDGHLQDEEAVLGLVQVEVAVGLALGLELGQDLEVLGQVGREHELDDAVPELAELGLGKVRQKVVLLALHHQERRGQVVVLQDRAVVVDHRARRGRVHLEHVAGGVADRAKSEKERGGRAGGRAGGTGVRDAEGRGWVFRQDPARKGSTLERACRGRTSARDGQSRG